MESRMREEKLRCARIRQPQRNVEAFKQAVKFTRPNEPIACTWQQLAISW